MCGIAGIFRAGKAVSDNELMKMTSSIRHRGPDGYGIKLFESGGIGHRRLSIIDLESGKQPMTNEDETLWITYNGEIYNYHELYDELIKYGHQFKTKSDTEVIVHGYEQWGYDVIKKLRGMFSFALADEKKKKIFVARDHFGIKPFYYFFTNGCFAFGSELQVFRFVHEFTGDLDLQAMDEYLWLQYIPAPKTIFKNIYKLKPAHYLVYNFNGTLEEPHQYWDVDFSNKKVKTEKEWLNELDAVLRKSVEAHLISDVPFGAFLSGGIDSTLIVSYMSQILKQPVKTFSIGFHETEFSELEFSKIAAKKYRTDHHVEIVKPDALEILPKLVQHYGEPYGDSSAIPTYYVSELARKHVTMVLSGDGGDECFAGYGTYLGWMKDNFALNGVGWKKEISKVLNKFFPSRYAKFGTLERWFNHIQYISVPNRSELWKEDFKINLNKESKLFLQLQEDSKNFSIANKLQYMDLKSYMPYDILTKVDIASMIHSLEVRTPLIDKEVWEFAATIPEKFNIDFNDNENKWEGKLLLKKILLKDFDNDFINRKKMGFSVPLTKWFAKNGELRETLEDHLVSENSNVLFYFERKKINQMLEQMHTGPLWLLLFLEEWLRNFKSLPAKAVN